MKRAVRGTSRGLRQSPQERGNKIYTKVENFPEPSHGYKTPGEFPRRVNPRPDTPRGELQKTKGKILSSREPSMSSSPRADRLTGVPTPTPAGGRGQGIAVTTRWEKRPRLPPSPVRTPFKMGQNREKSERSCPPQSCAQGSPQAGISRQKPSLRRKKGQGGRNNVGEWTGTSEKGP